MGDTAQATAKENLWIDGEAGTERARLKIWEIDNCFKCPIVNPIVFGSTAVAYGLAWDFAFLRLVFGYCIAVFVSFIFAFGFRGKEALLPSLSVFPIYDHVPENVSGTLAYYVEKTRAALIHGAENFP